MTSIEDRHEDLQKDIAEHRQELADTVDALAYKLDVRARLKERITAHRRLLPPALGAGALLVVVTVVRRRRRS
ncbi:MAG: DUF3618 domain-containing protein [Actinomycetota bacterium]|nr:DUF3618 domain-containing protein [Actinomycetota bacterium]